MQQSCVGSNEEPPMPFLFLRISRVNSLVVFKFALAFTKHSNMSPDWLQIVEYTEATNTTANGIASFVDSVNTALPIPNNTLYAVLVTESNATSLRPYTGLASPPLV
eukprot:CAMPEP_0202479622 /NCGR_PEP_ID=MMETSP1360-20130828/95079_1 /ASSEMBLY_ACC=CAM_ASM_000848 /TAXON_ID=515479 /ORGANISM="Licmophora paradoxa, Strain CCMP2313" /LENGTH=106 /DNA_ID=CAMNT_0049106957 /DNA_START=206 /DNA_END=526 /DNA_ORIENTATION=+